MGFLGYLTGSSTELAFGKLISIFLLLSVDNFTIDIEYASVTDVVHLYPASFVWVYSLAHEGLRKFQTSMAPLG